MFTVPVPKRDKTSELYPVYTLEDFPWDKIKSVKKLVNSRGRRSKNKPRSYMLDFGAFDIETTTIKYPKPGVSEKFIFKGYMYHWQLCLGGYVITGRYWEELHTFLDECKKRFKLDHDNRLILYVHNLAFEHQFLYLFLRDWYGDASINIFATDKRKPIYVVADFIEFRCSYRLTNMSLEKACFNEGGNNYLKAAGDLDYHIRRTAKTKLTETETGYCVADVVSLYHMVLAKLANESDTLDSIPLTNTGYIRRDTRKACRLIKGYHAWFKKFKHGEVLYNLMLACARGGDTHTNRFIAGVILELLDSLDMQSCYPAVMMECKYPMTPFSCYGKPRDKDDFDRLVNKYACMFTVTFEGLEVKKNITDPYVPFDKAIKFHNCIKDNGRILSADIFQMAVTDIDWSIIKECYKWKELYIGDIWISEYGYLPKPIRDTVMKFYKMKCELKYQIKHAKTQEEKENLQYLYAKSKNRLNSIFGMCFTKPVKDTIKQDVTTGEWYVEKADVEKELAKYYNSRNSFLYFPWGIWTTAHSRRRLYDMITIVNNNSEYSHCYNDTDSVKAMNVDMKLIDAYNAKIIELAEKTGAYCDVGGERFYLGVFEKENKEPIKRFCTLGAKKYCYEDEDGLHLTVSGVNKKLGAKELGSIENFKEGFIFHESGGLNLHYNDETKIQTIEIDGCKMSTGSNIGMEESTYTLMITDEYRQLINNCKNVGLEL